MKIKLNGEERVFDKELSLNELVQAELNSDEPKGVAVALNYKIIPLRAQAKQSPHIRL